MAHRPDPAADGGTTTPVFPVTAPLPERPGPEDWRALARSAPWRWTTATVLVREYPSARFLAQSRRAGQAQAEVPVVSRWFLRRGEGQPRVETPTGVTILRGDGSVGEPVGRWANRWDGRAVAVFGSGPDFDAAAATAQAEREELDALLHPGLRPDGLIARRPDFVPDPPMFQNYSHVALLDPYELADAQDRDNGRLVDGTKVSDVRAVEVDGRPAWAARIVPTAAYEPRCGCCALLNTHAVAVNEWGDERAAELGWAGPQDDLDHAEVALDVATGIVVRLRVVGGADDGARYELTVEDSA